MVLSKDLVTNNVDIGLGELAVATLLRTLATPHFLNLVPAEREIQMSSILQYVTCKRDGQVEVQAKAILPGTRVVRVGVQPVDDVDFFIDFSLASELFHRLDGASTNRCEAMKLEGLLKNPGHMVLYHLS